MSLDKAIKHGKEKRKQYRGSKAFDPTCRNHGSDSYATKGRLHNRTKRENAANAKVVEHKAVSEFENRRRSNDLRIGIYHR